MTGSSGTFASSLIAAVGAIGQPVLGAVSGTIPLAFSGVISTPSASPLSVAVSGNVYTFAMVQSQLNDLPATFTRPGAPYTQLIDALTGTLANYTEGAGAILNSLDFQNARYGWLDTWGLLFGITRNTNESDIPYAARITWFLNAWVGTISAIQAYIRFATGTGGAVLENSGGGYAITLSVNLNTAQQIQFLQGLARIRPAGVPFTLSFLSAGTYLDTVNYITNAPSVMGAYLTNTTSVPQWLGPNTNSALPLLPDLYLTDPILNPVFAS